MTRVLRHQKGRPVTMLHVELHEAGAVDTFAWDVGAPRPATLRDPTPLLLEVATRYR